jgi:hypothetical protein
MISSMHLNIFTVKDKAVPMRNYAHAMKTHEWTYSSTILDHSTRRQWGVSFMPLPLYPREKEFTIPTDGQEVGGPHSRSGRHGEGKNLAPAENRIPARQPSI